MGRYVSRTYRDKIAVTTPLTIVGYYSIKVLANQCIKEDLIMVSYESFEKLVDSPKNAMVFYEYFIRPVVMGEVWDKNAKAVETERGQYGTPSDHAFAHICFKNNEDDWKFRFEKTHSLNLLMPHSTEQSLTGRASIVDVLMGSMEFKTTENGLILVNDNAERIQKTHFRLGNEKVLRSTARNNFKKREETRKKWEKERALKKRKGCDTSDDEEEPSRARKKGGMVWKPYTGINSGRRRYSGWTIEGHQHFQRVCKDVRQNRQGNGLYVSFEKVYHQWKRTNMGVDRDNSDLDGEGGKFDDLDVEESWDF
jgi:hypothetical protein